VAVLAVGGLLLARRRALRHRFGPEYDRVIAQQPSRAAAEQELRDQRKHADLDLRTLTPQAPGRVRGRVGRRAGPFVDSPRAAVLAGDALLTPTGHRGRLPDRQRR
jgi:hypothetical protein